MDKEDQRQDEELAAFTDALLEGRLEQGGDRPPLAETVERLKHVLSPQAPPANLRRRVRQQIATEWSQRRPSPLHRLSQLFGRPVRRWAWVPVAALILVALTVALLMPPSGTEVVGTATGVVGIVVPVTLTVLAGALVIAWLIVKRRP